MANMVVAPRVVLNTAALQRSNYIHVGDKQIHFGDEQPRTINIYRLERKDADSLAATAQTIVALLNANQHLCAIFDMGNAEGFRQQIQQKRYLIINGEAVCLAEDAESPDDVFMFYRDLCFSDTLIREPVRCTRGHRLERISAQFWLARKGNVCPWGAHEIGPLNVDEGLRSKIDGFRVSYQLEVQKNNEEAAKAVSEIWQARHRNRVIYHYEESCQAIGDYLKYTSCRHRAYLHALGLHPDQVEDDPIPEKVDLIQKALCKCREPEQKRRFKLFYPRLSERFVNEIVEANLQAPRDDAYPQILEQLKSRVKGQDSAVEQVASILASQVRIDKNRIFLFVGPSGVGKTELAQAAGVVKERRYISFAMNQYQNEYDIPTFFGSSAGLVGSTDRPFLAKEFDKFAVIIEDKPDEKKYEVRNAVILFDEFEKAHSSLKQSMLGLFDEAQGNAVSVKYSPDVPYGAPRLNIKLTYALKCCVIVNTSNLYQGAILEAFNRHMSVEQISVLFKDLNLREPTRDSYRPELLGRMTVVPFGPIPRGQPYQQICKSKLGLFLEELKKEFLFREVELENEQAILLFLENLLYGNGINMRAVSEYLSGLKVFIQEYRGNWGNLRNAKLKICQEGDSLVAEAATYIDIFDEYRPTGRRVRLSR